MELFNWGENHHTAKKGAKVEMMEWVQEVLNKHFYEMLLKHVLGVEIPSLQFLVPVWRNGDFSFLQLRRIERRTWTVSD